MITFLLIMLTCIALSILAYCIKKVKNDSK